MDGQPATAESKHHYQSHPWSGTSSTSATPRIKPTSPQESSSSYFSPQLELLPILFPQQIYQDKLLQYNKLVSAGRGGGGSLQTPPLPPVLSSPQPKPSTRSRSSSKVSNKDNTHTKPASQSCHGNRAAKLSETADRALMKSGKDQSSKMSAKKSSEQPAQAAQAVQPPNREASARLPLSSGQSAPFAAAQSSSVPSTPHQHPRKFSFESREHSPGATQNHSPRSAYSETNGNVPSLRPLPPRLGGCRFETAVPHSRRRMPYSLGTDKLEKVDLLKIKSKLSEEEERKLETDMRELYDRLLPTDAIEINRRKLVSKLEQLFNNEWPGHDIQVHLFGSSGNLLCSDDSDVDICITTPWRELESVCLIADLLQRHGMEKVVCVSSAKVPIVKIWDPELKLACDMNVNNTLALENTRMVRTYVSIDDRVRPLAMIIKYWTRRRIINDAAFGGTLSSYTWICLIIAFLQLREPPILPALHQRHNLKLLKQDGTRSEFADDIPKLRGFGSKNEESLASLLFQFFRFYAHEFDYDKYALSIRTGKLLTKTEKKWHIGSNNALCVEEPFNTIRNLGNTADDTSFRGLHLELRRAFDKIAEGKFDECCEQYVFPKEEERIWQKPAPAPRPILLRSASQQQGARLRGGYRSSRQFHRNGNAGRRSSSSVAYETNPAFTQTSMPPTVNPQDILWYQTQSPQLGVPQELLTTSLNALAAQETMHRFQLYTLSQQQVLAHAQRLQNGSVTDRSRTNSFDNPPLTAPVRPDLMYGFGFPIQHAPYLHPGFTTYPSSPATSAPQSNGQSEFRRRLHRNTAANDTDQSPGSGALRSQSQPASRTPTSASQSMAAYSTSSQSYNGVVSSLARQMNDMSMPGFTPDETGDLGFDDAATRVLSDSPPEDDGPRYIGYYVNDYANRSRPANGLPSNGGAPVEPSQASRGGARRRLSTDQLPQSVLDRRMKRTSRSPSPLGHTRTVSMGMNSAPLISAPFPQSNGKLPSKPLIVNGTASKAAPTVGPCNPTAGAEPLDLNDTNHDNPLHIHQGRSPDNSWPEQQATPSPSSAEPVTTPAPQRPVIVNGSSTNRSPSAMSNLLDASFQQRVALGAGLHLPYSAVVSDSSGLAGFSKIHSRQQLAPLDLATENYAVQRELPHLSPVYEHRTPSPTVARKFEPSPVAQSQGPASTKELRPEHSKPSQRATASRQVNGSSSARPQQDPPATRSPIQDQRINGLARENGHVRAAKSQTESFGGWQKSKSRKKAAADLKHAAANGFPQSEQPPKNDADRKGG
ncbi:hypothetical protein N657DRAFT_581893 [Parathielavia appendiculata]|uniref:polynucleotide adenylyltransferase n=1 Tax=Parathielavia appendiculata TaxID=2587402 RepID=A0AAN6Z0C6_9PEZI|nr:hypothetical protein N657DRAFT_581893 [Parathielavia appendiculata]